jgi:hypothetical protein
MCRAFALVALVALTGCTFNYQHTFEADFSPPVAQGDSNQVFTTLKEQYVATGARGAQWTRNDPNYFTFPIGQGRTGMLREPFMDYVDLRLIPDDNLIKVTLGRVISHPIDFTKEQVEKFRAATETMFRAATGRDVILKESATK